MYFVLILSDILYQHIKMMHEITVLCEVLYSTNAFTVYRDQKSGCIWIMPRLKHTCEVL